MKRRAAIRNGAFLAGCGLSAGTIATLLSGCKPSTETAEEVAGFLKGDMLSLLGEVVETIIPTTDTPGAKAAGVHTYLNEAVLHFTEEEQGLFKQVMSGLSDGGFMDKTTEEKEQMLLGLNDLDGEAKPYDQLRSLVCHAYFTSEVGAKEALAYLPIPGEYIACMDLSEQDKVWALN